MSGYLRWSKEGRCMNLMKIQSTASTKRPLSMDEREFRMSYFKVSLSTRTALVMDRCHNFALVSTGMPLFMDITAKPSVLSTKSCGSMDTTPFSSSFLAFS